MANGNVTLNVNGATFTADADDCATVDNLIALFRDVANIPSGSTPLVDGEPATGSTPITAGQEVSVSKPAGQKG